MRLWIGLLAALALAPAAWAQDWATPEVCRVQTATIDDRVFQPAGRDALEAEAAKIENRRGRFWQVTSPEGAVSHLWGTQHSSDPLILDLPDQVHAAIDASRAVAVEINFVLSSRQEFRDAQYSEARFREARDPFALLPDDSPLSDLPDDIRLWVLDRAIELGWTEDAELILSPAGMAEMLLADPCEDFAAGVLPIQDDYIQLLGRLAGARIIGLEDADDFLNDMNAPQYRETVKAIIAVYGAYLRPITSNAERATSFAIYREGRLGLLAAWDKAFLTDVLGDKGADALRLTDDYLLALRNQRFMDRLAEELPEGGVFIAVGSGHLPGREGLVTMLRNAGYDVTRILLPGEAE